MKRFFVILFLFSCFFPYLRLLPLSTDHQPNAFLLGCLLLVVLRPKKMQWEFVLLFWGVLCGLICLFITSPNSTGISIFFVYLNLFLLPYISYISMSYIGGLPFSLFKTVVWIWGSVGFIQRFIYPKFLFFLLNRSPEEGLAHGRGGVGLAVEPTYYGMICLILMMILYLNFRNEKGCKFLMLFLIIQLVVFTMSTTCMLLIMGVSMCFAIYRILFSKRRFQILLISIMFGVGIYYLLSIYITTLDIRFANAIRQLLEDPSNFIIMDESVNGRFMHAFYPIKGFLDNWGMPHGFDGYESYLHKMSHDSVHWKYLQINIEGENRIYTMLGEPLFELGLFSFPMFYVIIKSFKPFLKNPKIVLCMLLFFFLSLNMISYTNSLIGLFIGNIIYLSHYHLNGECNTSRC